MKRRCLKVLALAMALLLCLSVTACSKKLGPAEKAEACLNALYSGDSEEFMEILHPSMRTMAYGAIGVAEAFMESDDLLGSMDGMVEMAKAFGLEIEVNALSEESYPLYELNMEAYDTLGLEVTDAAKVVMRIEMSGFGQTQAEELPMVMVLIDGEWYLDGSSSDSFL